MTNDSKFEVYLSISHSKFEIYLLDKKNLKNIYKENFHVTNYTDEINYNLLSGFLDKNIFKIEKLTGNFLKSVFVIIENTKTLNFSIGVKKKNYGEKINKKYLESSLAELKDLFKENYQNNKIIHFIINRYLIDGVNYKLFDKEVDGDYICVEVNFISVSSNVIKDISNVMEKYQIKVDGLLEKKYIANFFGEDYPDLSICAFKIQNGQNQNEISLVSKSHKKKGFFEKFFQYFS